MDIDKLAKLGELKDKGILTEEEFNTQKAALMSQPAKIEQPTSESSSVSGIIGGIITLAVIGFGIYAAVSDDFYWSLPKCDNKSIIKQDLPDVISRIPMVKLFDRKAIYVENPIEKSYNETTNERICQADVIMDTGSEIQVEYKLVIKNDQVLIFAEIID